MLYNININTNYITDTDRIIIIHHETIIMDFNDNDNLYQCYHNDNQYDL